MKKSIIMAFGFFLFLSACNPVSDEIERSNKLVEQGLCEESIKVLNEAILKSPDNKEVLELMCKTHICLASNKETKNKDTTKGLKKYCATDLLDKGELSILLQAISETLLNKEPTEEIRSKLKNTDKYKYFGNYSVLRGNKFLQSEKLYSFEEPGNSIGKVESCLVKKEGLEEYYFIREDGSYEYRGEEGSGEDTSLKFIPLKEKVTVNNFKNNNQNGFLPKGEIIESYGVNKSFNKIGFYDSFNEHWKPGKGWVIKKTGYIFEHRMNAGRSKKYCGGQALEMDLEFRNKACKNTKNSDWYLLDLPIRRHLILFSVPNIAKWYAFDQPNKSAKTYSSRFKTLSKFSRYPGHLIKEGSIKSTGQTKTVSDVKTGNGFRKGFKTIYEKVSFKAKDKPPRYVNSSDVLFLKPNSWCNIHSLSKLIKDEYNTKLVSAFSGGDMLKHTPIFLLPINGWKIDSIRFNEDDGLIMIWSHSKSKSKIWSLNEFVHSVK